MALSGGTAGGCEGSRGCPQHCIARNAHPAESSEKGTARGLHGEPDLQEGRAVSLQPSAASPLPRARTRGPSLPLAGWANQCLLQMSSCGAERAGVGLPRANTLPAACSCVRT